MLHRETIAVCSEIHTKHINTLCGQNVVFSGAFAKFAIKETAVSFVVCVCPSAWKNSAPTGWIFFMKLDI
jgi:hypothetical protein